MPDTPRTHVRGLSLQVSINIRRSSSGLIHSCTAAQAAQEPAVIAAFADTPSSTAFTDGSMEHTPVVATRGSAASNAESLSLSDHKQVGEPTPSHSQPASESGGGDCGLTKLSQAGQPLTDEGSEEIDASDPISEISRRKTPSFDIGLGEGLLRGLPRFTGYDDEGQAQTRPINSYMPPPPPHLLWASLDNMERSGSAAYELFKMAFPTEQQLEMAWKIFHEDLDKSSRLEPLRKVPLAGRLVTHADITIVVVASKSAKDHSERLADARNEIQLARFLHILREQWPKSLGKVGYSAGPYFAWDVDPLLARIDCRYVRLDEPGFLKPLLPSSPRRSEAVQERGISRGVLFFWAWGDEGFIDVPQLAAITNVCQTLRLGNEKLNGQGDLLMLNFVESFAGRWGGIFDMARTESYLLFKSLYRYKLRFCRPVQRIPYLRRPSPKSGLVPRRQEARIRGRDRVIYLREQRVAICSAGLGLEEGERSANIAIMLSDTRNVNWGVLDGGPWKEQSRYPCGDEACFGAFLSLITFAFDQWERGWMETLDDIDMVVGVELSDSMDDKKWERLMFDNSFRLSKLYFTVLQVLRIASSWIEESVSDLRLVQEKWSNAVQYETTDARNVTRELEEMVTSMEAKKQRLLSRVDKKVEEVKSLRDGLLGATSLREATKAMALNQYIYIFTIVTVVYTPVGFLAAFWALPFLNNPDDSGIVRTPSAFVSTFIAVPVATYAVCLILAAYSAKKRNSISLLFELQRFLWRRSYRRWQEGEEEDSDHEATRDVSASSLSDVSKAKNSASVPPV